MNAETLERPARLSQNVPNHQQGPKFVNASQQDARVDRVRVRIVETENGGVETTQERLCERNKHNQPDLEPSHPGGASRGMLG
jgi:hypothetical protein